MICNVSLETTFFASQSDPRAFVGLWYPKKKNDFFLNMCNLPSLQIEIIWDP